MHSDIFQTIPVDALSAVRVCMVITYSKSKDQPGKVANPARGQLNRKNEYNFPVPVRYDVMTTKIN